MFMTNDTAYAGGRENFKGFSEWLYDCKVVEHIVEKLDLLRAGIDLGDIFSIFVLQWLTCAITITFLNNDGVRKK